jgi:hypothetical protein
VTGSREGSVGQPRTPDHTGGISVNGRRRSSDRRSVSWLFGAGLCALASSVAPSALADAPTPLSSTGARTGGWAAKSPNLLDDVRAGKPVVIEVFVPLCSDDKGGSCGKHPGAGAPDDLERNLYWGAVWGARRYLDRKWLGWTRTEAGAGESWELERATYERSVRGRPWGVDGKVDVFLVVHALNGDAGADALERFRDVASHGGTAHFNDGSAMRDERVHAVGFMGRNPLLKNGRIPRELGLPEASAGSSGVPAFSIAAHSRETLAPWLHASGSRELLLARGAVASEGYVLEAIARGLADNHATWSITQSATKNYAKYQKLPERVAELYFSPVVPKRVWQGVETQPSGQPGT